MTPPRSPRRHPRLTLLLATLAAVLALAFTYPPSLPAFVAPRHAPPPPPLATAEPIGASAAVDMVQSMPGDSVQFPVRLDDDSLSMRYQWVAVGDTVSMALTRPLDRKALTAPSAPGFYRLAIVRDTTTLVLDRPVLAVMIPFAEKKGAVLNGYRIGTYRGERRGSDAHPDGFFPVQPADTDVSVSAHLRLADFITHDSQQDVWPKYVALTPRLLDKVELVAAELERRAGRSGRMQLELDVHSGFRTPSYNRTVPRAADDSRHQYGDAADIAVDANGDGRVNAADARLVADAVEAVEAAHPDLTGGLGIYTSSRYPVPYVHIDARGERKRWRG
ncbi:MAG TPA: D-Ala-D-Ala carboxypeptidase family metallohydrolase [Gemmatimonadaceae bacterium]|nr:D-Ala-D-Ala carboxypeptidase family metallohydrolase [Gemmatimonadaceae bacterium]